MSRPPPSPPPLPRPTAKPLPSPPGISGSGSGDFVFGLVAVLLAFFLGLIAGAHFF